MGKSIVYATLFVVALALTSCGGTKQVTTAEQPKNPFGEAFEAPCQIYDTDEDFTATGFFTGSMNQKGKLQLNARQNALQAIREKYANVYQGMVSNYDDSYGDNKGNDLSDKLQRAGDQVIEAELNHAKDECVKFSTVRDDGMVECYVAVRISKTKLAEKTAQAISNVLTDDEKIKIDFREEEYRKKYEERLAQYRGNR